MTEKTYKEWLSTFQYRKILKLSPEQEIADLVLVDIGDTDREVISLEEAPDKYKTPELCLVAVETNGYELQYVPDKFALTCISNFCKSGLVKVIFEAPSLHTEQIARKFAGSSVPPILLSMICLICKRVF